MNEMHPPKIKKLLSTRECIIITTTKLKLDLLFNALGVLCNLVCDVIIRNIFYDTVIKLSTVLQASLRRVSKEEIQINMPKCFKKFSATTSVLDCTEIRIQKPKFLKCCIKLHSHYKSDLTVKFMTQVTPAGLIQDARITLCKRKMFLTSFTGSATPTFFQFRQDATCWLYICSCLAHARRFHTRLQVATRMSKRQLFSYWRPRTAKIPSLNPRNGWRTLITEKMVIAFS